MANHTAPTMAVARKDVLQVSDVMVWKAMLPGSLELIVVI
jgi:hypothetical protein